MDKCSWTQQDEGAWLRCL